MLLSWQVSKMESTEISREDKPKSMKYSKIKIRKCLKMFLFFGKQNVMTSTATWITPSDSYYGEQICWKMEYNPHSQECSVPRSLWLNWLVPPDISNGNIHSSKSPTPNYWCIKKKKPQRWSAKTNAPIVILDKSRETSELIHCIYGHI